MEYSRLAKYESSAKAREAWQCENNITAILDPNSLKDLLGQQEKPWINNPLYFKQVKISDLVLLKFVMDGSSHKCVRGFDVFKLLDEGYDTTGETIGLLMGKIFGNVIIVLDAVPLPVEDTETFVDMHSRLLHYFETQKELGGLENVVGWYRTNIIGMIVTASDVETQMRIQELMEPSFGLVIDSLSTIDINEVHIEAFRTYPESYKLPILTYEKDPTAEYDETIFEMTKHLEKRYPLCITHFKFPLTNHEFQELWESYWARLVSMWKNSGSGSKKTVGQKVSVATMDNKENEGLCAATMDNKENEGGLTKYSVFTKQYSSADEALTCLYARLVEDVGSSVSMISEPTSAGFYVTLTKEQAKKLADNENENVICVRKSSPANTRYYEYDRYF